MTTSSVVDFKARLSRRHRRDEGTKKKTRLKSAVRPAAPIIPSGSLIDTGSETWG